MTSLQTSLPDLTLIDPNPERHAPITLGWFESTYGKETLLLMGNAEHEIEEPSLESETRILAEFVELKKENKQLTWVLQFEDEVIGVAWIELVENHGVHPLSVHLMIGNKNYRGRGIGKATMLALVQYLRDNQAAAIYSRHLKSNSVVANLLQGLNFINDGHSYVDDNGLEWQNVKLTT